MTTVGGMFKRGVITVAFGMLTATNINRSTAHAQPCSPNLCSGHGSCESSTDGSTSARQCSCNSGWMGADCSLMVCPRGPAWADQATGTDEAHASVECSKRGTCDRVAGVCRCDPGFEGQACGRRSCPDNCNNHGRCQSMAYLASTQDPGEDAVYEYDGVWDASMMYGCHCDVGYYGPACNIRSCSVGDDPLTGTEEVGVCVSALVCLRSTNSKISHSVRQGRVTMHKSTFRIPCRESGRK